jgi:L-ascorbate metabolism protein UlaG (beta-lactamase superfamily)
MKLTWLGHAAFELIGKKRILIDPFISGNPLSPKKIEELQPEVIAITHGHGDHLGDTIAIAKQNKAVAVAIHEIACYLQAKGIEAIGMNMGGSIDLGVKITMVPAWHSSGIDEAKLGFSGGTACGYIIEDGVKIYHAGDTALFSDLKLIGEIYRPEIALLPIGDRFTMNPQTAAVAVSWIKPAVAIPMHYNTFPLIAQDPEQFAAFVKEKSPETRVVILKPGETFEY